MQKRFIIGIDEVGRGPLAGPVAVGAIAASPAMIRRFRGIKESKQLSHERRSEWVKLMKEREGEELRLAVAMVSAKEVDRIGIAPAIRRALARAIAKLGVDPRASIVLLDGGLHAPKEYEVQRTIVGGDAKETAIAMASVLAKERRDDLMRRYARRYPKYGFEGHMGYGTKAHIAAIKKHGLTPLHRASFCRSFR